jgi:hypothetical protein
MVAAYVVIQNSPEFFAENAKCDAAHLAVLNSINK